VREGGDEFFTRGATLLFAQVGVFQQRADVVERLPKVVRRQIDPAAERRLQLRHAPRGYGRERHAGAGGFNQRQRAVLQARVMHVQIRQRQDRRHVAAMAEQGDDAGKLQLRDLPFDLMPLRTVADQHQARRGMLRVDLREQRQQPQLVLARLKRPDID
jgi:hypothetical protein